MADKILELRNLTFAYPGSSRRIVDGLNFDMSLGERIGIAAPNGAGKSTLFLLIMGLLTPESGEIIHEGKILRKEEDFKQIRKDFGLLFQDSDDQLFSPTVLEDVAFGPLNLGMKRDEAISRARETLELLGLNGFEDRITFKLSGGEKRLVSLATILAMKPRVLLLDEPASGLDLAVTERLKTLLRTMDLTYLVISHNDDFLNHVTNIRLKLQNGRLE